MNTSPKDVSYRVCGECGDVFGMSGQTAFGLARPVKPTRNVMGDVMKGTCPKHKRKSE